MTKPRILLDVDGVLCDFVGGVLQTLRANGLEHLTEADVTHYQLSKCLSAEALAIVDRECHKPGWCAALSWYPKARECLDTLKYLGDLYVVTAPWKSETWCHERMAWLEPWVSRDRVIFTSQKFLISGDWLIDDSPDHVRAFVGSSILIDRPWNRYYDTDVREESLEAATALLERMYGG